MTDAVQTEHSLKKQYLLASFFTKYQALMDFVQGLEIHPQFKQNAVTSLDVGMFWAREAIINIPAQEEVPPKLGDFDNPAPQESVSEPTPLE